MADHSVSHLSLKVSVLTVKSCIYFYMLLIWSSCYNTSVTGQHQVIGSSQDIMVKEGDEVILPCLINPPFNMARKTVEWSRPDLEPYLIHLLQDGHFKHGQELNPLYKERTSLFRDQLPNGNISLKLSMVKLSDEGTYRCSAPQQHIFTLIKLLVGSGSHPVISSNGPTDSGLSLSCDSGCWYPEPEMSWLHRDENNVPTEQSVTHRPSPHCYIVQRNVTVRGANNVTCRVHLPHINYTVETQRFISEDMINTEGGSTGSVIAGIIIVIIILVAAGLGYSYWKKKHPDVKQTHHDVEMAPLVNPADQPITYSDLRTNDEEIRIVMVGKTGAGKSASGNTILGPKAFESTFSPDSVTLTCYKASGVVDGRKVSVIDTPGLFDTGFSAYETRKCITCAPPGPHVFLAVIRLGRFTDEENVVAKIQKAFGQSSDKYTMILFTHGDKLESSIEEFVNDSPELQDLISKCSGFYHVFDNESKDPSQVTELLEKINKMVEENGGSHYTNQMFQEEVRRQELRTLMDSMNLTAASSDAEKAHFVMQHKTQLIQDVPPSTVMSIVDSLGKRVRVHPQLYAEIKAADTSMDQMKTLYTSLLDPGETSVRAAFYDALTQHLYETPDVKQTHDEEMAPLVNPADQPITYSDLIKNYEEIRIVMVGKTGAGKSATRNTILGPEAFKSTFSPDSVTLSCNKASGVVDGRKVSIIDTPGLFDTGFSNNETIKEVKNCISCAAPGPHVFLAVIKLDRFTDEERNVVAKIQKEFGQSSDKYTMILFTHGDKLEGSIEDFFNDSPELQDLISKYSGFYHILDNESKDPSQVTELLEKINQMVEKNGGSHYTNQMFQEEVRRQDLLPNTEYQVSVVCVNKQRESSPVVDTQRTSCGGVPAIKPKVPGCLSDGLGFIKGEEAVPHSWPWQVSLQDDQGSHFCGGSLINSNWVVTAAHCEVSTSHRVILGQHNLKQTNTQKKIIRKVFSHPNYNAQTGDYDIALIKLQSPAEMNERVSPVCVAETGDIFDAGMMCVATGWGRNPNQPQQMSPHKLQQVCVPLISNNSNIFGLTSRMLCAGAAGARDSGGPLVCEKNGAWTLVGVTSWAMKVGACNPLTPGVYSSIPALRAWMDRTIANN